MKTLLPKHGCFSYRFLQEWFTYKNLSVPNGFICHLDWGKLRENAYEGEAAMEHKLTTRKEAPIYLSAHMICPA